MENMVRRFEMNMTDEFWERVEGRRRQLGFKTTVETIRHLVGVALKEADKVPWEKDDA